eukprot:COSAG02_NODE_42209_length_386_cov_1.445993_1_plen_44_part_01
MNSTLLLYSSSEFGFLQYLQLGTTTTTCTLLVVVRVVQLYTTAV